MILLGVLVESSGDDRQDDVEGLVVEIREAAFSASRLFGGVFSKNRRSIPSLLPPKLPPLRGGRTTQAGRAGPAGQCASAAGAAATLTTAT
jgi:hypothetical protein